MPGYDRAAESALADSSRPNVAGVRSVFVDPAAARRGLAWAMMAKIEADAVAHTIRKLRVTATLSGVAFYARLGYRAEGRKEGAGPVGRALVPLHRDVEDPATVFRCRPAGAWRGDR